MRIFKKERKFSFVICSGCFVAFLFGGRNEKEGSNVPFVIITFEILLHAPSQSFLPGPNTAPSNLNPEPTQSTQYTPQTTPPHATYRPSSSHLLHTHVHLPLPSITIPPSLWPTPDMNSPPHPERHAPRNTSHLTPPEPYTLQLPPPSPTQHHKCNTQMYKACEMECWQSVWRTCLLLTRQCWNPQHFKTIPHARTCQPGP